MIKPDQYWSELQIVADEIKRLTVESQGPLIDENFNVLEHGDMDITEIVEYIRQFECKHTTTAWDVIENRGKDMMERFNVELFEFSADLWSLVDESPSVKYH